MSLGSASSFGDWDEVRAALAVSKKFMVQSPSGPAKLVGASK